jgi:hypothetical protein
MQELERKGPWVSEPSLLSTSGLSAEQPFDVFHGWCDSGSGCVCVCCWGPAGLSIKQMLNLLPGRFPEPCSFPRRPLSIARGCGDSLFSFTTNSRSSRAHGSRIKLLNLDSWTTYQRNMEKVPFMYIHLSEKMFQYASHIFRSLKQP